DPLSPAEKLQRALGPAPAGHGLGRKVLRGFGYGGPHGGRPGRGGREVLEEGFGIQESWFRIPEGPPGPAGYFLFRGEGGSGGAGGPLGRRQNHSGGSH